MTASDQCRFLQAGPVFICAAFLGGLRTPRAVEMEGLCRTPGHSRCPYYLARMHRETAGAATGDEVGASRGSHHVKEEP